MSTSQRGHIAAAVNIPMTHLQERLAELPRDRRVVIHCAGGYRSSIGASILQREGFGSVGELAGGIAAWETAGLPTESADPARRGQPA
jgi:rhodanese-related sulfurtransferase